MLPNPIQPAEHGTADREARATWHTERLTLRPLTAGDLAFYRQVYGDPALMAHVGATLDSDQADASFRTALAEQNRPEGWQRTWVLYPGNERQRIGLLGLVRDRQQPILAEMGAIVLGQWQQRGLAMEALRGLIARMPTTPPIHALRLRHRDGNLAAERICMGLGFSPAHAHDGWRFWRRQRDFCAPSDPVQRATRPSAPD